MKVAGVVAEYNPFHCGHAAQLAATRAAGCTHVAVVMSGNYVQRGEPAVCEQTLRARAALQNGADLVVELPLPWAVSSAEGFARGAVWLLRALGCVQVLSFGSETGTAGTAAALAAAYRRADGSAELKAALESGVPFAQARLSAARRLSPGALPPGLPGPNDALAAEYLRAAAAFGWEVEPLAVRRVGAVHDQPAPGGRLPGCPPAGGTPAGTDAGSSRCGCGPLSAEPASRGGSPAGTALGAESGAAGAVLLPAGSGEYRSASVLRALLTAGHVEEACRFLPPSAAALLRQAVREGRAPFRFSRFEWMELACLRRLPAAGFTGPDDVGEGLENRLRWAVRDARSLDEALRLAKTRRYAYTRLRRVLLQLFLGVPGGFRRRTPPYLRVLAANGRGRELLRLAARAGLLPVVVRTSAVARLSPEAREVFALESRAGDLYALGLPAPQPCGLEPRLTPFFASPE